jgi:hypothetical protein
MAVPNHRDVVEKVFSAGTWDLRSAAGCGVFTEAAVAALHKVDPRWGFLRKHQGQTQWNGHSVDGALYLSDTPGQSTHVDFIANAESSQARIAWTPDSPRYSVGDWYAPEGAGPAAPATHQTLLGCSFFWLLAGRRKYPAQVAANLTWVKESLGADFIRAFGVLGGDFFSGADPWGDLKTDWRSAGYASEVRDVTTWVHDTFGLKVAWTLVGGRAQVPAEADQLALVTKFAEALAPIRQKVAYVEMWNEYRVNNAERHELRNMARRFRTLLPDMLVALSSPDFVMGGHASAAEVREELFGMYGGDSGASLITVHPTRPEPIWNAETLKPYLPAPLPVVIGEPRGPGASAGGDLDSPALLASDYSSAIRANAFGHVFHPMAGIWGGHCDPAFPTQNAVKDIFNHRNAAGIAAALKALRATGKTPTIPVGDAMQPYPDENTFWRDFEAEVTRRYQEVGRIPDYQAARRHARCAYDIAVGLAPAAASKKHLEELEQELRRAA